MISTTNCPDCELMQPEGIIHATSRDCLIALTAAKEEGEFHKQLIEGFFKKIGLKK